MEVLYSTDQFVKIWAESRIIDLQEEAESCSNDPHDLELVYADLSKTEYKEKLSCFIECYDCQ